MALTEVCMICGFLMVFATHVQGLDFTINKTPGSPFCAHLHCVVNTDQNDPSIFSIVGLTIYDVTQAINKETIASVTVSVSAPELHVEPAKSDVVNASGSMSRYHADLSLDLKKSTDCFNTTFQCELDFMSTLGQLDSQQKSVVPSRSDCAVTSCELSGTFAELNNRTDYIENEINRLNNLNDNLEAILNNLLNGQQDTRPTVTNSPVSTQQPIITSCTRGMTHQNPREIFHLPGNVPALCDTETDGGGWIIIQRRTTGGVDFYKNWNDYKNGFGTPETELWIGNDIIHNLITQGYTELRVDLESQGNKAYAHYSTFNIGDETSNYQLTVSGYSGTAGDSLSYHSGMSFTTFDSDNDGEDYYNCGEYFHGAWWYKDCFEANLNGEWGNNGAAVWKSFASGQPLTFSEIKVRHV